MSNKWKVLLIISLIFNIAVAGALARGWFVHAQYAERDALRGEGIPDRTRGTRLGRRLGLSEDKMRMMGNIFDELHDRTAELRDSLRTARGELVDLLHMERPDETAVMDKIDEISSIQGELEKVLVRRLLRVHEILDPEERERFVDQLQRRMHSGRHHHMDRGGHRPRRTGGKR